jgi:hypothetical protein
LANLFKGYAAVSDTTFVEYMALKESNYDEGTEYSPEQLMQLAKDKYAILKQKGTWKAPSADQKKIIALEAQIKKLSDKGKPDKPADKKKKDDSKKNKKPDDKKTEVPKWMTTPPGKDDKLQKTVNDKTYYWCTNHGKVGQWVRHSPADCKAKQQSKDKKAEQPAKADSDDKKLKLSKALMSIVNDAE